MAGLKSWSRVAANNVLANTGFTMDEGQAPSSLNDSVRQLMADVATEFFKGNAVASATTPDITGTATTSGGFLHITGTVNITGFATATAGIRRVLVFDDALLLTHNGTSLILPSGANLTTAANDTALFVSEGSGNWRCAAYSKASGASILNAPVAWTVITADPSPAISGANYMANTSSAGFTITLPAAPSANDTISICDYTGTFATNNLTVGRNALKIMGLAENLILDTNYVSITLTYIDATEGWVLT